MEPFEKAHQRDMRWHLLQKKLFEKTIFYFGKLSFLTIQPVICKLAEIEFIQNFQILIITNPFDFLGFSVRIYAPMARYRFSKILFTIYISVLEPFETAHQRNMRWHSPIKEMFKRQFIILGNCFFRLFKYI